MKSLSKFLLVGSLFVSCSVTVFADSKVYPSSMCQPVTENSAEDLVYRSGQLQNRGTGSIFVQCPVIRDNPRGVLSMQGTRSASINVRGVAGRELRCLMSSKTAFGDTIRPTTSSTRASSTRVASNVTMNLDVDLSVPGGQFDIYCIVPPRGRIYSYTVHEF